MTDISASQLLAKRNWGNEEDEEFTAFNAGESNYFGDAMYFNNENYSMFAKENFGDCSGLSGSDLTECEADNANFSSRTRFNENFADSCKGLTGANLTKCEAEEANTMPHSLFSENFMEASQKRPCRSGRECFENCNNGCQSSCDYFKELQNKFGHEQIKTQEQFADEKQSASALGYLLNSNRTEEFMNTSLRVNVGRSVPSNLIKQSSRLMGLDKKNAKMPNWYRRERPVVKKAEFFNDEGPIRTLETTRTMRNKKNSEKREIKSYRGQSIAPRSISRLTRNEIKFKN